MPDLTPANEARLAAALAHTYLHDDKVMTLRQILAEHPPVRKSTRLRRYCNAPLK